jgi:CheY-like chemotaxis protein
MGTPVLSIRGRGVSVSAARRRRRVLVVEDEAAIRRAIVAFLTDAGYVVAEAEDGQEALARMRESLPDVVVLDLQLPTMSGSDFLNRTRADLRLAAVPIVILSADPGLTEAAATLGARGALAKPFDLDILLAVVDRVSRT